MWVGTRFRLLPSFVRSITTKATKLCSFLCFLCMTQWFLNYVLQSGTILIDLVAYTMVRALKWKIEIWFLIYSCTERNWTSISLFLSKSLIYRQLLKKQADSQAVWKNKQANKQTNLSFAQLFGRMNVGTWELQTVKGPFCISRARHSKGILKLCIFT